MWGGARQSTPGCNMPKHVIASTCVIGVENLRKVRGGGQSTPEPVGKNFQWEQNSWFLESEDLLYFSHEALSAGKQNQIKCNSFLEIRQDFQRSRMHDNCQK